MSESILQVIAELSQLPHKDLRFIDLSSEAYQILCAEITELHDELQSGELLGVKITNVDYERIKAYRAEQLKRDMEETLDSYYAKKDIDNSNMAREQNVVLYIKNTSDEDLVIPIGEVDR